MSIANVRTNLAETLNPHHLSVSEGSYDGHRMKNKFGENSAVGTSYEDIRSLGSVKTFATVTGATTTSVVSGSASDQAGTTGALTVKVEGLDLNYNEISEIKTLNGITPTTLTAQYIRVHRMKIITAGSLGYNVGTITASIGSNVEVGIPPQENQTLSTALTVPRNHIIYIDVFSIFSESSKILTLRFQIRPFGSVWQTKRLMTIDRLLHHDIFIIALEKSDIRVQAKISTGTAAIAADYLYHLVNYGDNYNAVAAFAAEGGDSNP